MNFFKKLNEKRNERNREIENKFKEQKKLKKIKFEDKEYDYESLSDEAKNDVTDLQVCEAQLKMCSDTIKLISISRQSISEKLKEKLKDVTPS